MLYYILDLSLHPQAISHACTLYIIFVHFLNTLYYIGSLGSIWSFISIIIDFMNIYLFPLLIHSLSKEQIVRILVIALLNHWYLGCLFLWILDFIDLLHVGYTTLLWIVNHKFVFNCPVAICSIILGDDAKHDIFTSYDCFVKQHFLLVFVLYLLQLSENSSNIL